MLRGVVMSRSSTYLLEADLSGELTEAATREVEAVLADDAAVVAGNAARMGSSREGGWSVRNRCIFHRNVRDSGGPNAAAAPVCSALDR